MHDNKEVCEIIMGRTNECFKTVNGMEACTTQIIENAAKVALIEGFQNRKRYGGMHDSFTQTATRKTRITTCFKTVNGMEACTTSFLQS